jgi:hypothetical protein
LRALPPQGSASTNFATRALNNYPTIANICFNFNYTNLDCDGVPRKDTQIQQSAFTIASEAEYFKSLTEQNFQQKIS